jgi:hypothetical protein
MDTLVTIVDVDAFVTAFRIGAHTAIHAIPASLQIGDVVTLLAEITGEKEIAIFVVAADVGEIAVVVVDVEQIAAWNLEHQFLHLRKERTGKIDILAIIEWIPRIAPPCRLIVDFVGFIG